MTTRVYPLSDDLPEMLKEILPDPPTTISMDRVLGLHTSLFALDALLKYLTENKDLKQIIEVNNDGSLNIDSLPREMHPQFAKLIRSINISLVELEK